MGKSFSLFSPKKIHFLKRGIYNIIIGVHGELGMGNGHLDSFLRALREDAPEMELFLENHGQYMKKIVIKLINIQSCTFRHFTKKLYLEEYVGKDIPPHFFAENLSQTLL